MHTSPSTSEQIHWYDNIWAALIFFTRLPFWRIHQPPQTCYSSVVEHWPLAGWLTGGFMAGIFWLASLCLPLSVSIVLAMAVRLLITGALHEDGLADFFDGFGGGYDRERILAIMKDSRIGTYGVLGLFVYELLVFVSLSAFASSHNLWSTALLIVAADSYSKLVASQIIRFLPYARTAETAKNKVVYRHISFSSSMSLLLQGGIPIGCWLWLTDFHNGVWVIALPIVVFCLLYRLMKRKIQGYTGDCCGALCLLCELACYLAVNL